MKAKFLLIVIILLTGCAGFHREALSPSLTASEFECRTLESTELRKYLEQNLHKEIVQWPPKSWGFNLLVLAALYYHPDMDVARARWGVAKAGIVTAGGRPNPGISLLGQHHSDTTGGISAWTWGASFDIPFETAGKRGYRIRRAEHLSDAARLDVSTAAWRVWGRLRKSLLALYSSSRREQFLEDALAIRRSTADIFERRLAVGESSRFELTNSRVDLDRTRLLLSETQKQKAEARASLAGAIGLQVNALAGTDISFDIFEKPPEAVSLGEVRRQALVNRSDISAALSGYEAAQSALQLEIARQYPDVHIGPGYEWDQGDNKWSLGLAVELPILNRNEGPIQEARARRKDAAAKFRALQAAVIGKIDKAQAAYLEALKKLEIADTMAATGKDRLQMALNRFDSGAASRLDLEQARLEFSLTSLARFDAFVSAQEGLGMLEDAVQRPLNKQELLLKEGISYLESGDKMKGGGAER